MENWHELYRPLIEAALPYAEEGDGVWAIEQVEQAIANGEMQVWLGHNSVGVTQVRDGERGRRVHVMFAGGKMPEVLRMHTTMERWARTIGANRITMSGRRGWQRVFRKSGYRMIEDQLTKGI